MNRYALIVGVGVYVDKDINKIKEAENDAVAVRNSLIDLGVPQENAVLLVSSEATFDAVGLQINQILRSAAEGDEVTIYMSGHGVAVSGLNYFLCYDSATTVPLRNALPISRILDEISKCKANRVLLLMDSCHSGVNLGQFGAAKSSFKNFSESEFKAFFSNQQYKVALCSCREDELSYVSEKLGVSVWTHHLLAALKGDVKNVLENNCVELQKLQQYLSEVVPEAVKKLLGSTKNQNPMSFGGQGKMFLWDLSSWLTKKEALKLERVTPSIFKFRREADVSVPELEEYVDGDTYDVNREFNTIDMLVRTRGDGDVSELVRSLYGRMQNMGYRIKEINKIKDLGTGEIKTPDFKIEIDVGQSIIDEYTANCVMTLVPTHEKCFEKEAVVDLLEDQFDHLALEFRKDIDVHAATIALQELSYLSDFSLDADYKLCKFSCKELKLRGELSAFALYLYSSHQNLVVLREAAASLVKRFVINGIDLLEPSSELQRKRRNR